MSVHQKIERLQAIEQRLRGQIAEFEDLDIMYDGSDVFFELIVAGFLRKLYECLGETRPEYTPISLVHDIQAGLKEMADWNAEVLAEEAAGGAV